jgi:arylsulfatase
VGATHAVAKASAPAGPFKRRANYAGIAQRSSLWPTSDHYTKATNWEGGFRVPCLIRWPGVVKPGTVVNEIRAHEDFIPTFAVINGDANLVEELKQGRMLNGKNFKAHLDGYNLLRGDDKESPRKDFLYWSDDGDLMGLRYQQWKITVLEQAPQISPEAPQGVWTGPFTKLRVPKLYNLRADPFERGPESIEYVLWMTQRVFLQVPAQAFVTKYLDSFKDLPPRAKPASFTVSDAMEKIEAGASNRD